MNEETKTPEPLAAILAEMRDGIHTGRADIIDCVNDRLRSYADRVEAAAKREQQDAMKTAFLTKCKVCEKVGPAAAPGNATAMREALENARSKFIHIKKCADEGEVSRKKLTILCEFASQEIAAALSAPVRNCDRFADATEMARAFLKDPYSTLGRDSLVEVAHRFAEWSFLSAPARNADRFATAKEALDAFIREKEITSADVDSMNLRDFFDWLFAPAEGGDHA